ncbi:MAG: class I fructose-bisphosphate aldolase [Planctomycetes bacterium]|nr:class I fructose-bisphosphate aldolase [Planctomycetota bacterium]
MSLTPRVREILSWYPSDNPGVKANLARMLMTGRLAGTGKMVILPVDQGFEHGPDRTFGPNPAGYDPCYHANLAVDAGCNAYAAPLGQLEAAADRFPGVLPLILKLNNSDSLGGPTQPWPAITGSVGDALRLGCSAVGFTIYPGSDHRNEAYGEIREIAEEAKANGIAVVIWSYPRGGGLTKEGETAVDVVAYAAHIAAQLGAHIVKVKPPTATVARDENRKVLDKVGAKFDTMADRIRHVVQATFAGRRIVVFSGGEAKDTAAVLDEVRGIHQGGGFGSIVGRNSFQRKHADGVQLLQQIMDVYAGK